MQRIIPYLIYDDAPAAIEFLCKAFAFEEQNRWAMPDGRIGHAQLSYGDNVIWLASAFEELGYMSPRSLPASPFQVYCYVEDVDAHFVRAKAAGTTIIDGPADQFYGDRRYRATDLEGHRWIFATRMRDLPSEETQPPP